MASAADCDFETVTLIGEPLERAKAALRVAQREVSVASEGTESPRLETVLEDIEDDIGGHLKRIDAAVEDDADEFAGTAEWWTRRQAEQPPRAG